VHTTECNRGKTDCPYKKKKRRKLNLNSSRPRQVGKGAKGYIRSRVCGGIPKSQGMTHGHDNKTVISNEGDQGRLEKVSESRGRGEASRRRQKSSWDVEKSSRALGVGVISEVSGGRKGSSWWNNRGSRVRRGEQRILGGITSLARQYLLREPLGSAREESP